MLIFVVVMFRMTEIELVKAVVKAGVVALARVTFLIVYDDDDVYLRLQHGKGFHNLVYMSYIKHINPASKA
jgi:hypothetical protein